MSISTIPSRASAVTPTVVRAGRLSAREIGRVDLVHRRVVALEVGQEDAHADHVGEGQAAALQHARQIVHDLAGLRLDAVRDGQGIVVRIGCELSGDEDERRRPPPHGCRARPVSAHRAADGRSDACEFSPLSVRWRRLRRRRRNAGETAARVRSRVARRTAPAAPVSTTRPRSRNDHAGRGIARETHFVGDDHHGHALAREIAHHHQHLADQLRIERAGRLVEQQQVRAHRERARDPDALLLSARQPRRKGIALVG